METLRVKNGRPASLPPAAKVRSSAVSSVSGHADRSSGHTDPTAWLLPPPSLLRRRRRTLCRTQSMGVDTGGHLPCATADGVDDDYDDAAAATTGYARSVSVSRARTPAAGPSVVSIGVSTRASVTVYRQSASGRDLVIYAVFFFPVLFCFVFLNFLSFAPPPVDHPTTTRRDVFPSDRFVRSIRRRTRFRLGRRRSSLRDALRAVSSKTTIS